MILLSIKKRCDFLKLSNSKIRFHSSSLLVLAGKTPDQYLLNPHSNKIDDFCRFGLTVTKKIGNAVTRNKAKRRLRNIMTAINREEKLLQNQYDYSIIAKHKISDADFNKISQDLKFCLKHIKRIIKENDNAKKQSKEK
jgi:ribonuclease P protein component